MSRHRFIRNLDLTEEMSSDPISSDDDEDDKPPPENYPGITSTQGAQMESGLIHVRSLLGGSNSITDRDIRESLWDTYFDVEGTVGWLLEKRGEGSEAAQKEKIKHKDPHSKSETVAALVPLSPLQRLSLASQEGHKTKQKLPLSSLARKMQHVNAEVLSPSHQTLSASQQPSLLIPPRTRISEDATQKSPLVSPTSSNLSSLARKAIDRNSAHSENGSSASPRTSKLAQKIKLAQSASKKKGPAFAADDSVQSSHSPLSQDTTLFENPKSPPDILFPSFDATSRLSSPPKTRSDIPPVIPIAASASTFASILVSGKDMSLSSGARVLLDNKGFRPTHNNETLFTFNTPSPDDIVLAKRAGTRLAKERAAKANKARSVPGTPTRKTAPQPSRMAMERTMQRAGHSAPSTSAPTPASTRPSSPAPISPASPSFVLATGVTGLSLSQELPPPPIDEPAMSYSRTKLLEEARRSLTSTDGGKTTASMVVIGHVDAGKSTLIGRLMYELGQLDEKQRVANERASDKLGKSSFSWAWGLDALSEERDRGITMDITQTTLPLPTITLTILDAPGHKDFVPNLISGASQADTALLVVDASVGEFEVGFRGGGQTREHILLVRSLGVSSLIIAINKLDMVEWSQTRYNEICGVLRPFLVQSGFQPSRLSFVPCAAMKGVNLTANKDSTLKKWYSGPTLAQELDKIVPPSRDIDSPLRLPVSNVFRGGAGGISAGVGVSGRICSGVLQVGEKLRVVPGDEIATVRKVEIDDQSVSWAAAGANVTLYLSGLDLVNISVGRVLCPSSNVAQLASHFVAQIILFDLTLPITSGATIELFHHSRDTPATISKLIETIDRSTGVVLKTKPRVLTKNTSARVEIRIKSSSTSAIKAVSIPLETFTVNKDMGRILLRRGGETIGAGIITEIIS